MQIKACFKKEFMFFTRTFRIWGIVIAIVGLAIFDPIMLKGIVSLTSSMNELVQEAAESTPDLEEAVDSMDSLTSLTDEITAESSAASALGDITNVGMLVILLVLMGTAGGEQKKRSTIIPTCSGLKSFSYALPKFIFYPCSIIAITTIAGLITRVAANLAFEISAFEGVGNALLAGLITGIYCGFILTAHLTFGICTGKPGISAAVVYILAMFVPAILSIYRAEKFNPFTLTTLAGNFMTGAEIDWTNLVFSIVVTIILTAILFFVTLFALNAKRVDNTGEEPTL